MNENEEISLFFWILIRLELRKKKKSESDQNFKDEETGYEGFILFSFCSQILLNKKFLKVEYSLSNRASCKECGEKIEKGVARIGKGSK